MRNELGVPVPAWTVVASWAGWGVVVLLAIAATVSPFSTGVLLVVVSIAVATGVLLVSAHLASAEARRQTAVVRDAVAYGWGRRPRSWRWHGVFFGTAAYFVVVQLWFALEDGTGRDVAGAVLYSLWIGSMMVWSAVGKSRRERRVRATPTRVELRPEPPLQELPPKPVRGERPTDVASVG